MSNILILTSGFPPLETYGGPTISISNLVNSVDEHNFFVIANSFEMDKTPAPEYILKNEVTKFNENTNVVYVDEEKYNYNFISGCFINTPDLIYVNSFFNYPQLKIALKLSKNYDIPVLIAPRGELEYGALRHKPSKFFLKKGYISLFNYIHKNDRKIYFQATSTGEEESIKSLISIAKERVIELDNLPSSQNTSVTKTQKENGKINIIFISRIQIKKNLKFALECLSKVSDKISVTFDIYGPIENEKYWEECLKIISSMPNNVTVNYMGQLNHNDVINKIGEYDLFFLPTMSENFGHVIYEALKANTLILISDQTPWIDINASSSGKAYSLNSKEEYTRFIEQIANASDIELKQMEKNQQDYLDEKIDVKSIIDEYSKFFYDIRN